MIRSKKSSFRRQDLRRCLSCLVGPISRLLRKMSYIVALNRSYRVIESCFWNLYCPIREVSCREVSGSLALHLHHSWKSWEGPWEDCRSLELMVQLIWSHFRRKSLSCAGQTKVLALFFCRCIMIMPSMLTWISSRSCVHLLYWFSATIKLWFHRMEDLREGIFRTGC